jgi:hypothetical protein
VLVSSSTRKQTARAPVFLDIHYVAVLDVSQAVAYRRRVSSLSDSSWKPLALPLLDGGPHRHQQDFLLAASRKVEEFGNLVSMFPTGARDLIVDRAEGSEEPLPIH